MEDSSLNMSGYMEEERGARALNGITSNLVEDPPPELDAKLSKPPLQYQKANSLGPTTDFKLMTTGFTGQDVPEVLEFKSWWLEEGPSTLAHPPGQGTSLRRLNAQRGHGTRHTMTVYYFVEEQLFQVHIDDTPDPFTVRIARPDGSSLEAWDLYVGARLDILGRPTTLMKASCETYTWLDKQAQLMLKQIKRLEEDLAKFQPLSLTVTDHSSTLLPHRPQGGKVCLRRLVQEIENLDAALEVYRGRRKKH
jgi:hypothetical protein